MLNDLEPPACQQAADICSPARLKIVDTDDLVTLADQALAEMGPEKSRPAGNNYVLWLLARVLARQDVARKVEHDLPHIVYAAMPFPRHSSHPQSSYAGGDVRTSYYVVLRLCHGWARLLLLSAGRRHTAGFCPTRRPFSGAFPMLPPT